MLIDPDVTVLLSRVLFQMLINLVSGLSVREISGLSLVGKTDVM